MRMALALTVNGEAVTTEVEPRMSLADLLRERLRLTATHLGCEHGVCGACTVLIDGVPARACIALAVSLEGADVRTLEGMADDPAMAVIKDAFHQEHGLQCGFCTPGMLITTWDLIRINPNADAREVRTAISGNLCRCTGYQGIVRSILRAARQLQGKQGKDVISLQAEP
jgi:carbon-monoxide dehydrogenase small subunit